MIMELESGTHVLSQVILDGRIRSSQLLIMAGTPPQADSEPSAWLGSVGNEYALAIAGNAPDVMMHGLGFDGAMLVNSTGTGTSSHHAVDHCQFVRRSFYRAARSTGGGIHVHAGGLSITSTRFTGLAANDGGAIALTGVDARVAIAHSQFYNNSAVQRGGAVFVSDGRLTLDGVNVTSNAAGEKGGGLYAERGYVFLRAATILVSNTVQRLRCDGAACGAAYFMASALDPANRVGMFYVLPAPAASYVTLTSDCREETIRAYPGVCAPKYRAHVELRDALVTELVEHQFDGTFPVPCPAGVYGRPGRADEQRTNSCSGPCPGGHECATQCSDPKPCPPGTFCPPGSTRPEQCPGGTVKARIPLERQSASSRPPAHAQH